MQSRSIKTNLTFKKSPKLTLKRFADIKNKVLIIRRLGGMGDILMHRLMFEDIKNSLPSDVSLTFACPKQFHDFVADHPFIDKLEDSEAIDIADYIVSYDTTRCCLVTELSEMPLVKTNRPDIWSKHCGITLQNYNMHFNLSADIWQQGIDELNALNQKQQSTVLFCPYSVSINRSLTNWQIEAIVKYLRLKNCFVFAVHHMPLPILNDLNVPVITATPKRLMSLVNAANYIVSVDTGPFHLAGGLRKPLMGIFAWTDGKVRGNCYDFILVQKHRDDGWECGPCWQPCAKSQDKHHPCITEITIDMLENGIEKMFEKYQKKNIHLLN